MTVLVRAVHVARFSGVYRCLEKERKKRLDKYEERPIKCVKQQEARSHFSRILASYYSYLAHHIPRGNKESTQTHNPAIRHHITRRDLPLSTAKRRAVARSLAAPKTYLRVTQTAALTLAIHVRIDTCVRVRGYEAGLALVVAGARGGAGVCADLFLGGCLL